VTLWRIFSGSTADLVREEGADDAGPDGVVDGGPELRGEAEEHGLGKDTGLGGHDAGCGGHPCRDGRARCQLANSWGVGIERAWWCVLGGVDRGEAGIRGEYKGVGGLEDLARWWERRLLPRSMLQSMKEAAGILSIAASYRWRSVGTREFSRKS
jgi:hypothetical protein